MYISFFICFQLFWEKTSLSNKCASLFTQGVFPKIKKMYMKKVIVKVIVKIEAIFFIVFKQGYRDLI